MFVSDIIGDIKRQTYGNWELIIVGNGPGQEKQRAIVKEFAESDNRISYYSLSSPGVSHARNFGIDKAEGDWLAFVDVDDNVPSDWLQKYLDHVDSKIDMIVGGICFKDVGTSKIDRSDIKLTSEEVKSNNAAIYLPLFLNNMSAVYSVWSKLYRLEFLREAKVRFEESFSMCEDGIFALELALKCKSICLIPQTGYEYCQRNGASAIRRYHACFSAAAERRRCLMDAVLKRSGLATAIIKQRMAMLYASDSLDALLNEFRTGAPSGLSRKVVVAKKLFADENLANAWKLFRPSFSNLPLFAYYLFYKLHIPLFCVMTIRSGFWVKQLVQGRRT